MFPSIRVGGRPWELGPHPQTQGQLVHLDLSVVVDVTVAQEDCPKLVQLGTSDAGLVEEQAQTLASLYNQKPTSTRFQENRRLERMTHPDKLHHVFNEAVHLRPLKGSSLALGIEKPSVLTV